MITSDSKYTTPQAGFKTSVVKTLEEFKTLSGEWQILLNESGEDLLSLTHQWLVTWLENFPVKQIFTVLIRDSNGKLLSVAPLKISLGSRGMFSRLIRYLQFIGTEPCVYDQIKIICNRDIDRELVLKAIAEQIIKIKNEWDVLDLRYCNDFEQMDSLCGLIAPYVKHKDLYSPMSNFHLQLPQSIEAYEKEVKKNYIKKHIKNSLNRLKKDFGEKPPELKICFLSSETSMHMEKFFENHIKYWHERGFKSDFARFPNLKDFYKALYYSDQTSEDEDKKVQFSVLNINNTPVSYHMGLWSGKKHLVHLCNYDSTYQYYRPGLLHMDAVINDVICRGGIMLDFGRGDESYKSQWTDFKIPLWNLVMFKSKSSLFLWQLDNSLKKVYLQCKKTVRNINLFLKHSVPEPPNPTE